jgi:hypothetical protein
MRVCRTAGWRLIAWINGENETDILLGLGTVADRLGIDTSKKSMREVAMEVRNRLEADGGRCLIVFDNVADLDALHRYAPSMGDAQVLITSTDAATRSLGKSVSVDVFTESRVPGLPY